MSAAKLQKHIIYHAVIRVELGYPDSLYGINTKVTLDVIRMWCRLITFRQQVLYNVVENIFVYNTLYRINIFLSFKKKIIKKTISRNASNRFFRNYTYKIINFLSTSVKFYLYRQRNCIQKHLKSLIIIDKECENVIKFLTNSTSQKLIVCVHRIFNSNLYLVNMDLEISQVFESRRENIFISINNFKFAKYRVLKSGNFYFRCTNKKCNGLYVVNKLYTIVIQVINDHSKHSEYSAKKIEKEMNRSVVKRKAETELHIQPRKIIRQTLHLNPEMQKNLLFKSEQFIYLSNDENVVILTCLKNLSILCNAQHVFGDGTFDYCPKLFNQLYTIYIYQNHLYVPDLCVHTLNQELNIKEFHEDFEIFAHNVLLNLYPDCKIVVCTFHLAYSWFRQIQSNKQLLLEYNNKNSNIGNWLKSFFEDAFTQLISDCPTSDLSFSDYVLETYILPDSKFNPMLWAGHPKDEPRTTNCAEAFHRHFNQQFYIPHPRVHQIADKHVIHWVHYDEPSVFYLNLISH
ncbi:hypothetical protein QTP88_018823 [Uroleucon formosanum]